MGKKKTTQYGGAHTYRHFSAKLNELFGEKKGLQQNPNQRKVTINTIAIFICFVGEVAYRGWSG